MAKKRKYETQSAPQASDSFDPGRAETQGTQESDAVREARETMEGYEGSRPEDYTSGYADELAALYEEIFGRAPFAYDPTGDALYQQYKNQYTALGRQAMQDTMGQAAALTGGYGSTYAESVGGEAYRASLSELDNILPELYKLAYSRYSDEGKALQNRYDMLSAKEAEEYARWQDEYARWQDEYDRARDAYNDAYERDYRSERDRIEDERWQKEFDEKIREYNESMAAKNKSSGGSGSSGGSKGKSQPKATPLSTDEYRGAEAAARKGRSALGSYCDRMQKEHNLTKAQRDLLYNQYDKYTPEAARDAYGGEEGATGYYV